MNRVLRSTCKLLAGTAGFVLLAAGGIFGAFMYFNSPPSGKLRNTESAKLLDANDAHFLVREGESATSVGGHLKEAGFIKSLFAWQLLCHFRPAYLQAGMYKLDSKTNLIELYEFFTEGRQILIPVTVPEGSTLKRTARILEEALICSSEEFLSAASSAAILREYNVPASNMEGYLYPDTYHWTPNYPASSVVRTMAATFYKKLGDLGINTNTMSAGDIYSKVILASIVEREYRIADEAPVMAGVFLRRLKTGMRLESCATVVYVLTEIDGKEHPKTLFYSDLEEESPYNTYIHKGLPPGPISSPGEVALRAAFFPAETDYLFFRIVDPKAGRHYFSKSFDDHIKAGSFIVK
ncbi:MAG: endolytic transglycosylase MltG [Termitinemataceae bacterium]|nr:MAG: endolytic transglycosylase MltG [Termitinemataceae bacterium]